MHGHAHVCLHMYIFSHKLECACNASQRMGEEADNQGQGLDTLHARAETTVGRIQDVNNKSQLRKFDVSAVSLPFQGHGYGITHMNAASLSLSLSLSHECGITSCPGT